MSDERTVIEVPLVGGPRDGSVVFCFETEAVPGERLSFTEGIVTGDKLALLDYVFDVGIGDKLVLRHSEWQGGTVPGGQAVRDARDDQGPDEAALARMRQQHEAMGASILDACMPGTHQWAAWQPVRSGSGNSTRRCKRCTVSQGRIF